MHSELRHIVEANLLVAVENLESLGDGRAVDDAGGKDEVRSYKLEEQNGSCLLKRLRHVGTFVTYVHS